MSGLSAVLDACVLLPMPTCDLLLRLADAKEYRPLWSHGILVEVERKHTVQGLVDLLVLKAQLVHS